MFGGLVIGIMLGAGIQTSVDTGDHSYHAARIIVQQGTVVIRAVESPCAVDDKAIETIIDGKLVSRSKPVDFLAIWGKEQ